MKKFILAAGFAALAAAGAARAEDTVESLRQPVIDICKTQMAGEAVAGDQGAGAGASRLRLQSA